MAGGRAKAFGPAGLPADGVPDGVVQLLKIKPDDDSLDRIQVQKEATPVPGRCQNEVDAKRIFRQLASLQQLRAQWEKQPRPGAPPDFPRLHPGELRPRQQQPLPGGQACHWPVQPVRASLGHVQGLPE